MVAVIERPDILTGVTIRGICGCGKLYVTINELNGTPIEVFVNLGKSGSCANTVINSTAIIISHGLRAGVPLFELATALLGMKCERRINAVTGKGLPRHSCMDALSKIFLEYLKSKGVIEDDFGAEDEIPMDELPQSSEEPSPKPEKKIGDYKMNELKKLPKEQYVKLLGEECARVRIVGVDECNKCLTVKCRYKPEESLIEPPVQYATEEEIVKAKLEEAPPPPIQKDNKKKIKEEVSVVGGMTCRKCGGQVVMEGACDRCLSCGFSKKCGG